MNNFNIGNISFIFENFTPFQYSVIIVEIKTIIHDFFDFLRIYLVLDINANIMSGK